VEPIGCIVTVHHVNDLATAIPSLDVLGICKDRSLYRGPISVTSSARSTATGLKETRKAAAPYLTLVIINGVDAKHQNYLLQLDQGDFDVAGWIKQLQPTGHKGPVGLECFGVNGDVPENLKADIAAWRRITSQ